MRSGWPRSGRRRREPILGGLAAALLLAGGDAGAATNIQADTAPGLGLGTTVTVKGSVYTINNGALVGPNLFESFSSFSLAVGATARWTYTAGPAASIGNVINRVTGGAASQISGRLDTTALPNADFYFINPAGIVFGTGASVNVPGAAHFTTASQLVFKDGAVFSATTATGSTLSMAPPSAFGFLGGEGDIAVAGVGGSFAKAVSSLSLVAANIQVSQSAIQPGRLDLIAAGNQPLSVPVNDPLSASGAGGSLTIGGSTVTTQSPAAAGVAVDIAAGAMSMTGSTIRSTAPAPAAGGPLMVSAQTLSMDGSGLFTSTAAAGDAGDIVVAASGDIQMMNHAFITSSSSNAGGAGSIDLKAGSLSINKSNILSTAGAGSTGRSGSISLDLGGDLVAQAALIESADVDGDAGRISVTAQSLSLDNSDVVSQASALGAAGAIDLAISGTATIADQSSVLSQSAAAIGGAAAGPITVTAQTLVMTDAKLQSSSTGNVVAAAIDVDASGDATLNDSFIQSTLSHGIVGPIAVSARSLALNGSGLLSEPHDAGPGGEIDVVLSGPLTMTGQGANSSFMHSISRGPAVATPAGAITVTAPSAVLTNADVESSTYGAVAAGPVNFDIAGQVSLLSAGGLASQAKIGSSASGGSVTVKAQSLLVDGGFLNTSTGGTGGAGSVTLDVADSIDIKDTGVIHSSANPGADGPSGQVSITSASLTLESGAEIFTNSSSAQPAGNVFIGGPNGSMIKIDGRFTGILSQNFDGGPGGNIQIEAAGLVVSNAAQIHTDAGGKAGNIVLDFPNGGLMFVESTGQPSVITTNSKSNQAGTISINNPTAIILDGSDIEAQGPSGGALVTINSPAVVKSSDNDNTFIVTGVIAFNGQYVDIAGSVALSDLSFVDASKVLQGRCAARGAGGGTSRLTTRLFGPYPVRQQRRSAGPLAWGAPGQASCGGAAGRE